VTIAADEASGLIKNGKLKGVSASR